jgi:hypothetical protein
VEGDLIIPPPTTPTPPTPPPLLVSVLSLECSLTISDTLGLVEIRVVLVLVLVLVTGGEAGDGTRTDVVPKFAPLSGMT